MFRHIIFFAFNLFGVFSGSLLMMWAGGMGTEYLSSAILLFMVSAILIWLHAVYGQE